MKPTYTRNGRFGLAIDGALATLVYPTQWQEAEFDEWLALFAGVLNDLVSAGQTPTAVLVFANGQSLSTKERAKLAEKAPPPTNAPPMRQALLTNNGMMRGVLTAVGWLMNKPDYQLKPFSIREWRTAFVWLSAVGSFDASAAKATLLEMLTATGNDPTTLE